MPMKDREKYIYEQVYKFIKLLFMCTSSNVNLQFANPSSSRLQYCSSGEKSRNHYPAFNQYLTGWANLLYLNSKIVTGKSNNTEIRLDSYRSLSTFLARCSFFILG